jgi:membrane protease YdiL (CAAX protease family)
MTAPITPTSLTPQRATWGQLISTMLLVLAALGAVLYGAIALGIALGWMGRPESRVAVFLAGSALGELAAFAVLTWRLHRRGGSLRDLGWGRATNWRALALGLGIALAYSAYTTLNPQVRPHLLEVSALKLLAVGVAIVAGVVEETIFRGYVMTMLGRMGYGVLIQIVLSGLVFALVHFYGFLDPVSLLIVQGSTLALGLALAITYVVGRRSLTPVILSHALIDSIIEPWLILSFFH